VGDFETRFIWEQFEKMQVSAVSPGPRELGAWTTFKDLMARNTIPVIESNVTMKSGAPIGVTTKVVTVNGVRLGLFSLMGGTEFSGVRPPDGVEFAFQDPFQAAATLVPTLRKQCDVVVLMSQMGPADTDRLLQSVPGIDVALYGQRASYEERAKKIGETIAQQTGTRGQYVGSLVLIVDPAGKIVDYGSQNAGLDKAYPEQEVMAKAVGEANDQVTKIRADARKTRQSDFENKISGERFIGAETCKRCHQQQYDKWASSPHGHALASLDKPVEGKPRSADCLKCHTTGYGGGGYDPAQAGVTAASATPDLANVQCETCHGKGSEHTRTGKIQVSELVCRSCHTPEWSPQFDYKQAMLAVKH
jgi:hypothetical protein